MSTQQKNKTANQNPAMEIENKTIKKKKKERYN